MTSHDFTLFWSLPSAVAALTSAVSQGPVCWVIGRLPRQFFSVGFEFPPPSCTNAPNLRSAVCLLGLKYIACERNNKQTHGCASRCSSLKIERPKEGEESEEEEDEHEEEEKSEEEFEGRGRKEEGKRKESEEWVRSQSCHEEFGDSVAVMAKFQSHCCKTRKLVWCKGRHVVGKGAAAKQKRF